MIIRRKNTYITVANGFYGWGIIARLDDNKGILLNKLKYPNPSPSISDHSPFFFNKFTETDFTLKGRFVYFAVLLTGQLKLTK